MLGKILIVDQIATNRIALRAKLGAAQFDVAQAASLREAMSVAKAYGPDLVLTTAHLPDGKAEDLLAQIQGQDRVAIPSVLVLCDHDSEAQRLTLLRAGANDVVASRTPDVLLLARIRTLVRASNSDAEWRMRDDTTRALGFAEATGGFTRPQNVHLVGSNAKRLTPLMEELKARIGNLRVEVAPAGDLLPSQGTNAAADAYVLVFGDAGVADMLRLMSTIRCHKASRNAAIFVLQECEDAELAAYALDMGADDLTSLCVPAGEICLRLSVLLRRKRQADELRATVQTGLEAAVSDPLTGLHNRRYAMPHLARLLERAQSSGRPVAVMLADMDHFKRINDRYGHAAGDAVLIETSERLRNNLRAVDLVARIGGEEFLIVLPGVTMENARKAANRLCTLIHEAPCTLPDGAEPINVSVSIGLTIYDPTEAAAARETATPESLVARADKALYRAKEKGRNRVRLARPAA